MSNLLIVESENDKYFIGALIEHLHSQPIEIEPPICDIDDYECLGGLSSKKLTMTLSSLKNELLKRDIQKIGIILDLNNETEASRLQLINKAIKDNFETDKTLSSVNEWITVKVDNDLTVKIAGYFTNVEGKGELETVLKAIKSQDSIYADCLQEWRNCLEKESKNVSDKEFDKFWISIYHRFDGCTKREKYQAARKCSYQASMKKALYNFDDPILEPFKQFLSLLTSNQ